MGRLTGMVPTAIQAMALATRAVMVTETRAQRPSVVARAAPAPFRRRRTRVVRFWDENTVVSWVSGRSGLKAAPFLLLQTALLSVPRPLPRAIQLLLLCPPIPRRLAGGI